MPEVNATKNKLNIPFLITLIGSLIMIISIFLPYASAKKEYADRLKSYSDEILYDGFDVTAKDIINISMAEYTKMYIELGKLVFDDSLNVVLYVTVVALIGGFSLLTLLFSALKKPIAIMIFDILAFGVFYIQNRDYTSRHVVPSNNYQWGAGYYLFYIASIIVFAGAVWMFVNKIKAKRESKLVNQTL